jgi:hypothetical protein
LREFTGFSLFTEFLKLRTASVTGKMAQAHGNRTKQMERQRVVESGAAARDRLLTLREARTAFYRRNDFPQDGGARDQRWPPLACRDLKVHLPNFKWRRRALPLHDLHHVITGYEFSPRGEFQMAAWEFAAGRYPSALSTCFCLPLVCMGAAVIPRQTFAAFVRGRRSRTLYNARNVDALLDKTVGDVQREFLPAHAVRADARDRAAFALLVAASSIVVAAPFAAFCVLWLLWR